jgi:threonine aldolase
MIDLRSDTVTRPTPPMLAAMSAAEVGDDVWGDDPTVLRLQAAVAERTGKQAGLFFPSGTQSNLAALMAHCARGDEYIVGQLAHTYKYEGGGAAVLGSIQPQPLENAADGSIPLDKIAAAIKPIDNHFARTRLLALENTIGGKVLPAGYVAEAVQLARQSGLSTHLDGARVYNAAVASGKPVAALCEPFDSVSICFSKGLGAPVGSVLVGSQALIDVAHRWRTTTRMPRIWRRVSKRSSRSRCSRSPPTWCSRSFRSRIARRSKRGSKSAAFSRRCCTRRVSSRIRTCRVRTSIRSSPQ